MDKLELENMTEHEQEIISELILPQTDEESTQRFDREATNDYVSGKLAEVKKRIGEKEEKISQFKRRAQGIQMKISDEFEEEQETIEKIMEGGTQIRNEPQPEMS